MAIDGGIILPLKSNRISLGAIKIDLNRNLGTFVGDVEHEVAHCFETRFPACDGMRLLFRAAFEMN